MAPLLDCAASSTSKAEQKHNYPAADALSFSATDGSFDPITQPARLIQPLRHTAEYLPSRLITFPLSTYGTIRSGLECGALVPVPVFRGLDSGVGDNPRFWYVVRGSWWIMRVKVGGRRGRVRWSGPLVLEPRVGCMAVFFLFRRF